MIFQLFFFQLNSLNQFDSAHTISEYFYCSFLDSSNSVTSCLKSGDWTETILHVRLQQGFLP